MAHTPASPHAIRPGSRLSQLCCIAQSAMLPCGIRAFPPWVTRLFSDREENRRTRSKHEHEPDPQLPQLAALSRDGQRTEPPQQPRALRHRICSQRDSRGGPQGHLTSSANLSSSQGSLERPALSPPPISRPTITAPGGPPPPPGAVEKGLRTHQMRKEHRWPLLLPRPATTGSPLPPPRALPGHRGARQSSSPAGRCLKPGSAPVTCGRNIAGLSSSQGQRLRVAPFLLPGRFPDIATPGGPPPPPGVVFSGEAIPFSARP